MGNVLGQNLFRSGAQTVTTVRKLRTRRQIYHAAGKLLQDIPYDKLRATQIAEEALISRSGFYLYFSDKDAMVSSYYDFLIRKVTAIYDAHRKDAADVDHIYKQKYNDTDRDI